MPSSKARSAANGAAVATPHRVSRSERISQSNHAAEIIDERELLAVLTEVRNGNFTARMPIDKLGLSGKICDTLNEIISLE